MDYEKLIRELVDKKAEQDNQIDLHAYENGMRAFEEANAKLIAESGTVANETGMTLRELQESHAELLESLMLCLRATKELNWSFQEGWDEEIEKAEQAIKKATL